jgi:Fe-S cluster assembly protein SufD
MKPAPAPTEAERALSELFERRSATFTETPLDAARAAAFERFAAKGLPHRRVEAYKYTDLKARLRSLPPIGEELPLDEIRARLEANPPLTPNTHRVVIANGRFVPTLSSTPGGVRVEDLLDPAADTSRVGQLVKETDDPLTLANVGLFEGGVVIHVDDNAAGSIEIVQIVDDNVTVMGRAAVFVAQGATCHFVERVLGGVGAVTNTLVELDVATGAHVEWIRFAEGRSSDATNLSTLHMAMEEKARLEHLTVSTGTGLARAQVFCFVNGDEAEANFRAATVAIGERHADNTLVVHHDALNSSSSEVFRSAVGKGGTSVVQGRIFVEKDAQKTDARMMSNALFLDETGEVVNKPELEIFADDVACGHGATSGDLDEDSVFYLRARGIPEVTARRILAEAFVIEALDRVEDETIQEALAEKLREALDAMGGRTWT